MTKCILGIPIDTNQHNPTKIIDGCQVLKGDFRRYRQLWPKMQLCKMAELRKRKWNPRYHLVAGEFSIRWQHLITFIMYIVQLYKEDWAILHMLGCQAIALLHTKQIAALISAASKDTFITID